LAAEGRAAGEVQQLLDRLDIELVLTAHPTEAKRRSIRQKLRRLRELLQQLDQHNLLPREVADLDAILQAELTKLWQTDFIRPWAPTVDHEVQRGLSIMPVLWEVVPDVLRDLRQAVAESYPGQTFRVPPLLRFGSWIGGDRDGHPGVTAEVTEQTLVWLRKAAVAQQRETACSLYGSLSLSSRQAPVSEELRHAIATAILRWPELEGRWRAFLQRNLSPLVGDRRLEAARVRPDDSRCGARLRKPTAPVSNWRMPWRIIQRSLSGSHNDLLVQGEIQRWLDQIQTFGLHLARLDVRQDARQYEAVMAELLAREGVAADFRALPEADRQRLLLETMGRPWTWEPALCRRRLVRRWP